VKIKIEKVKIFARKKNPTHNLMLNFKKFVYISILQIQLQVLLDSRFSNSNVLKGEKIEHAGLTKTTLKCCTIHTPREIGRAWLWAEL
jgi:hypothetical protein